MKRLLPLALFISLLMPLPAQAAPTDCNAIVSMSQGRQVYYGAGLSGESELEGLTDEQWMVLFRSGKTLSWWTTAANWVGLSEASRCGTDAEIDYVLFIFDPQGSGQPTDNGATMLNHLNLVLGIMANRYPNAVLEVSLLVGAEGHVTCTGINGQGNPDIVRASRTHAQRIGQMTLPEAGPDLDIPCSGYSDTIGHLNASGASDAQGQVADWFNAMQVDELVVPETIPHPGISSTNGFRIGVNNLTPTRFQFWNAPYLHVTPYVANSGWRNGDRLAYHCAFAFLEFNGEIVGRVTFRAVPTDQNNPDGAYVQINDTYMEEANDSQTTAGGPSRFFDGSVNSTGMQGGGPVEGQPFGECPQDVGVDYESANVPDERPNVVYAVGNQAVELRDYRTVNPAPGLTFDVVEVISEPFVLSGYPFSADHVVTSRVTVLARYNGDPVAVVYYDGLGSGRTLIAG